MASQASGNTGKLALLDVPEVARGIAVGLSLLTPEDAAHGEATLPASARDAYGPLASKLASLSQVERAGLLARWARAVFRLFPPGLQRVHPSWLHAALASEPPCIRRAVYSVAPAPVQALLREAGLFDAPPPGPSMARAGALFADFSCPLGPSSLCWALLGHLCLWSSDAGPTPALPDETPSVGSVVPSPAALLSRLAFEGAEALGCSLAGAPEGIVARALASVGADFVKPVLQGRRQAGPDAMIARAQAAVAQAGASWHVEGSLLSSPPSPGDEVEALDSETRLAVVAAYARRRGFRSDPLGPVDVFVLPRVVGLPLQGCV